MTSRVSPLVDLLLADKLAEGGSVLGEAAAFLRPQAEEAATLRRFSAAALTYLLEPWPR